MSGCPPIAAVLSFLKCQVVRDALLDFGADLLEVESAERVLVSPCLQAPLFAVGPVLLSNLLGPLRRSSGHTGRRRGGDYDHVFSTNTGGPCNNRAPAISVIHRTQATSSAPNS